MIDIVYNTVMTYYEKNKRKILARNRAWKAANKEKTRGYSRKYRSIHWNEELSRRRARYSANPEQFKAHTKKYKKKKMDFINVVRLHYGCTNPKCKRTTFEPEELDFHHIDPKTKIGVIKEMKDLPMMIAEINKCTVLCACCHRLVTNGKLDNATLIKCNVTVEMYKKQAIE